MQKTIHKNNENQGLLQPIHKKTVSSDTFTQSFDVIRVYLTEDGIGGVSEHLDQIEAINSATENDIVEVYCIGCPGGSADTIIAILNALSNTPAHTVTILEGHNASAASMPMMVTDEVHIGRYSSVMFHNVAGGVGGNMTNTAEAAKFYEQHYNKFFAELYTKFLDEKELELIQNGREIYLDFEQIQERLESRKKYFQQLDEEQDEEAAVKPKKSKKGNSNGEATT